MAGHDITEVDTHTAKVHVPDPGDYVKASDLEAVGQSLGNRTNNHNLHGLWDSVKKGAGNLLTYLVGNGGAIEIMSGGKVKARLGGKLQLAVGGYIESEATDAANANMLGWFSHSGPLVSAGDNGRTIRRITHAPNSNSDITIKSDKFYLPLITANRVRTVRTGGTGTTPEDGEDITVIRVRDGAGLGAFSDTLTSQSGNVLFTFGSGYHGFVVLTYSVFVGDWIPGPWGVLDASDQAGSGLYGN